MDEQDRVAQLVKTALADARRHLDAGDVARFLETARAAIVRGHVAATWAAIAQRGWGGRAKSWLGQVVGAWAMPADDRKYVRAQIARELAFFDRFAAEAPSLSPQQVAARADRYAGATRTTYDQTRWAAWDIPAHLWPGQQECGSNCRCRISLVDLRNGWGILTRTLHEDAAHCGGCLDLAGEHRVRRRGSG